MESEQRKMAFVCSKGDLDMAYPALIMGWAALGEGIDVTLFFTFWGMDMITKDRQKHLELAPVANTSLKMRLMGLPTGTLGIPNLLGIIPGMTAFTSWFMKKKMAKVGAPPVDEYMQMMSDGGAKFYACKMSVDMFDLKKEDLLDYVEDIVTVTKFLEMTGDSQIIFI